MGEKQDVRADPGKQPISGAGSPFGLSLHFSRVGITPHIFATQRRRIFQVFLSPYRLHVWLENVREDHP